MTASRCWSLICWRIHLDSANYNDLPFAILRYDPDDEWNLRRQLGLLRHRLEQRGKRTKVISLADLLWKAIDETEGMATIRDEERDFGYEEAEQVLNRILSDADFAPLPDLLAQELNDVDPERSIAFLIRAGAMSPNIYHMSKLLDEMQGRTRVPTVLCYPGGIEGTTGLRFMDRESSQPMGNYRVKIYG